jgi:hypothetical protein
LLEEKLAAVIAEHNKRKLQLQPFIILVGELDSPDTAYLVVSSSVKYPFKSLLSCFSSCFKLFFALNLRYPLFGYRFWLYIQREVFEIILDEDKHSQISEISCCLKRYL